MYHIPAHSNKESKPFPERIPPSPVPHAQMYRNATSTTTKDMITETPATPPTENEKEAEPDPPQDGESADKGYLKIMGGFFVYFMTLGQFSAFSTFQDYYEVELLSTYSASAISWIGTTQVFLVGIVGLLSGAMYDRGLVHEALLPGFTLAVVGMLLISFSHQFWHILLSQGFLVGIGGGLVYIPAITIVSHKFAARPALALGITASGSAIGGIILPILFRRLLPRIGFAWTSRVLALLILALSAISYYVLTSGNHVTKRRRRRLNPFISLSPFSRCIPKAEAEDSDAGTSEPPSAKPNKFLDAFKGQAYQFLCIGVSLALLGYWVPIFYLVPYASRSLGIPSTSASDLLSILNAASLFGRILPATVGHRVGAANILLGGALVLGALILAWISVNSRAGITIWSVFLGFTAGSVITIPNAVCSRLSNASNTGLRIGNMWAVGAFAELIGPPIAGALLTQKEGQVSYLYCQIFSGLTVLVGAVFLAVPAWSIWRAGKTREVEIPG